MIPTSSKVSLCLKFRWDGKDRIFPWKLRNISCDPKRRKRTSLILQESFYLVRLKGECLVLEPGSDPRQAAAVVSSHMKRSRPGLQPSQSCTILFDVDDQMQKKWLEDVVFISLLMRIFVFVFFWSSLTGRQISNQKQCWLNLNYKLAAGLLGTVRGPHNIKNGCCQKKKQKKNRCNAVYSFKKFGHNI